VAAATRDIAKREISHFVIAGVMALGVSAKMAGWSETTWTESLAGLMLGFLLSVPLFFAGGLGGGDVKLFAAVAAVLGPTLSVLLLMATMLVVVAWNGVAWLAKAKGSSLLSSPMGFAPPFLVAFVLLACWVHARDQRLTAATDRVAMSGERHAR